MEGEAKRKRGGPKKRVLETEGDEAKKIEKI